MYTYTHIVHKCTHHRIVSSSIVVSKIVLVQLQIMAYVLRDAMMPLGWLPGAEFRLTSIDGDVHQFYTELFEGLPHMPIPQRNILWEVTAVHRITAIFITADWTTVQFCPRPTDYPKSSVWVRVRHLPTWFAEIVKPGN